MGLDAWLDAKYKKTKRSKKITLEKVGYWRQNWVLNAYMGKLLKFNIDDNGSSHVVSVAQLDKLITYCEGQASRRKDSKYVDEDCKWGDAIDIFLRAKKLITTKNAIIVYWFVY